MSILSGQTIRRTGCVAPLRPRTVDPRCGMSWGLSAAGYDVRVREKQLLRPGDFFLASTVERFQMPDNILAQVTDKSTLARRGVAVQNTIIEPGWCGFLTLELTLHGPEPVLILRGQPIAQVVFYYTDEPVEEPYRGKYQDQPAHPVGPLKEVLPAEPEVAGA